MAFALTPTQVHNSALNCTTTKGRKLFHSASKSHCHSDKGFECPLNNPHGFIKLALDRAQECNWDDFDDTVQWDSQGVLIVTKENPANEPNVD